ncbi:MAG: SurA N-terminal domain-containing protein [Hyphomicrobium sp.]
MARDPAPHTVTGSLAGNAAGLGRTARLRLRPGAPARRGVAAALCLALGLGLAPSSALAQGKPTRTAKAEQGEATSVRTGQSIAALVNDEPITGYEIDQRIALSMLGSPDVQKRLQAKLKSPGLNDQFKNFAMAHLKANPPKSEQEQQARVKQLQGEFVASIKSQIEKEYVPTARKQALDELIDERLKLQEAKRLSIVAADDEVDRIIGGMAERNKMTAAQFAEHISKMGASIQVMRDRIRASLSWTDVIRRKFGSQITVANRDVDKMMASSEGQDEVELRIHRILLSMPPGGDQKRLVQRMADAAKLRDRFSGCKDMEAIARGEAGVRFDNLGDRRPSTLPEPTRSLLLAAHEDEMLPATIGESGVELWAVCGRKVIKAAETKRETAENQLRQKEFEIISKKHLKDLRQDAHIEYR